ncbi:MAG: hypothetical protein GF418_11515 [Chitinivibrionales bacterium]|nr:hypothetical protein [Chitinivibrionales bacterium]MBD3396243.1 hypothetical protein [Chitinivibrionales bacterium]
MAAKTASHVDLRSIRPGTRRPVLPVPPAAKKLHSSIVAEIRALLALDVTSPLDPSFTRGYHKVLELFERYQGLVIQHSGNEVTCGRGCTRCCFHWVEDVYSFEAETIAQYIHTNTPDRIDAIVEQCVRDTEEIERLDGLVTAKLGEHADKRDAGTLDPVDLLLASFYQLRRPCPLLDEHGGCGVYPVRPLTCRMYVSFSDPVYCDPEYINVSDVRTYHLDLEEEASALLDQLHLEFDRFGSDLGLRSLLVQCLR